MLDDVLPNISCDTRSATHTPVEPCDLPDDLQLVFVDDRDRRRTLALEDAAVLDFGMAKAFRKPPAYRGQRNFPGWWWSATTRSHVVYGSWLERHHIIEADRDARVAAILGRPFELTWPEGKEQVGHVPDLLCRMLEGQVVVIDCHSGEREIQAQGRGHSGRLQPDRLGLSPSRRARSCLGRQSAMAGGLPAPAVRRRAPRRGARLSFRRRAAAECRAAGG
jgi:hypothetical protein